MTVTLITGANKGLGHEGARRLIAAGHTVYMGARDAERGRDAEAQQRPAPRTGGPLCGVGQGARALG